MQKEEKTQNSRKKTSTRVSQSQKRLQYSSKKNIQNTSSKSKVESNSIFGNIIHSMSGNKSPKQQKDKHKDNVKYSQDIVGVKKIIGGMVLMNNGKVVCIQEVIPLNFYQKDVFERNDIYNTYKELFRVLPSFVHFKMRTEKADVNQLINNILSSNDKEDSSDVLHEMHDYIDYIRDLQQKDSMCKRFYIIWEYQGDSNGKRSTNINDIYNAMEIIRFSIKQVFSDIGQLTYTPADMNWYVCELLYKFFNPKTSNTEPFYTRFNRIKADELAYNIDKTEKTSKKIYEDDFIAPKGIKRKANYIVMDGVYHTFITLKDTGHPPLVYCAWIDSLCSGLSYDVDILAEKRPYNITLSSLKQINRFSRVRALNAQHNQEKQESIMSGVYNVKYVTEHMEKNSEDLWDVLIIITVKANSYQNMNNKKTLLLKKLNSKLLYAEDSFLVAWKNFNMIMPFTNINRTLFNKNKRNYLTSSMAALYNYTAYELFSDTGIIWGRNTKNGSILAVDNFDTDRFVNPNILLLGSTGSGKTFTELCLSRRMRLTNMRTFFVLPIKAYEYYDGIKAVGGTIVKLYPGGRDCVNFMQIRPEVKINKDLLSDDIQIENKSLLSKKIVFITTFLQLLMRNDNFTSKELNILNGIISDVYSRFGITSDNDSIYRNKKLGILKEMPIPQDLYDALLRNDEMERISVLLIPFVEGNCQNFNNQTNVDLTNSCIAFDIEEEMVGEELLAPFMYIATDCLYDLVKQDMMSKDTIVLDEVWKMMANPDCAKQVYKMVKVIRGYAGCMMISSQEVDEFINQSNGFGKTVVANTDIKILKKLKKSALSSLDDCLDLNTEDKAAIKKYTRERGMLYTDNDKIPFILDASEREVELFTTDVNVKQEIRRKHAKANNQGKKVRKSRE